MVAETTERMMQGNDTEYHRQRAEQERLRAARSTDEPSRQAHVELERAHELAAEQGGHRLIVVPDW
ncbi:hypothetical protein [Sphingomonas sp. R86520]|uniref:hypothetical protein n=1 Tax=Sphingomonas sp. R86520 TaxID=3093859 RepID=UPI0036D2F750